MTIDVNVMCDGCKDCPFMTVETATMCVKEKQYKTIYSCKHIEKCRKIVEIAKGENNGILEQK